MLQSVWTASHKIISNRLFSVVLMTMIALCLTIIIAVSGGISFGEVAVNADSVQFQSEFALEPDIPTHTVHILVDGESYDAEVFDGTVADALKKIGITLGEYDECVLDMDMPVGDGMTIEITRVSYVSRTEKKSIPYETVYRSTNALPSGSKQLTVEGKNGEEQLVYTDRFVNGECAESLLVEKTTLAEPVNEVYSVGKLGSKALSPVPFSIDLNEKGQPVKYKDLIVGTCSAYTSDRGNAGTVTSSGKRAQIGIVAVDPSVIPYGTKMYIVSKDGKMVYGYAVAGDTGGAMTAGRAYVDLFMNTYEECIQFGRREMNIYILE